MQVFGTHTHMWIHAEIQVGRQDCACRWIVFILKTTTKDETMTVETTDVVSDEADRH